MGDFSMDADLMNANLDEKVKQSKVIIREAITKFGPEKIAIAWTSGKDSTILLHLVREVYHKEVPLSLIFVDTGKHFETVYKFRDDLAKQWNLHVINAMNTEVINATDTGVVKIRKLSEDMQREIKQIDWTNEEFRVALDREPCCHTLKTVATKKAIIENGLDALMVGIRWDEQESRSHESYYSPRTNPTHVRVHPILHFKWDDVWEYIKVNNVPYNPLYDEGFTSIGCFTCTNPNPEGQIERGGRAQDKEQTMKRLRALGYF
jgi:phosphoadenosine phosphosulfate reductase